MTALSERATPVGENTTPAKESTTPAGEKVDKVNVFSIKKKKENTFMNF